MHKVSGRQQASYDEEHVASVLAAAGIEIESEVPSDYIIFCPYHNNYRTPAGEVSKESGLFYCFSCNTTASLEELVMKVTGKSYFQAMRLVGSSKINVVNIVNKMDKSNELVEFDQGVIDRLHSNINDRALTYLRARNILDDEIEEFEIGYSVIRDSITIPAHSPSGMVVGFQGRSIEGKEFLNSDGFPGGKILFNLHRVRSYPYVYVLESPLDVIRCHQLGIPAVSTFGAGVSKAQRELVFKYFPEVYVVPDRDDAGRKMALTFMDRGAILVPVPEGYNDVGNLTDEGICTLLDRSNPVAGIF